MPLFLEDPFMARGLPPIPSLTLPQSPESLYCPP